MNDQLILGPRRVGASELIALGDTLSGEVVLAGDRAQEFVEVGDFATRWGLLLVANGHYLRLRGVDVPDTEAGQRIDQEAAGMAALLLLCAAGAWSFIKVQPGADLAAWEPFRKAIERLYHAMAQLHVAIDHDLRTMTERN